MFLDLPRITVVTGHYGTGKSEFSLNLALFLKEGFDGKVYLADLDVVNPYFRSRGKENLLAEKGIKVISSGEAFPDVDLPYMPGTVSTILQDKEARGVIDAGGDPAGARVLARYAESLKEEKAALVFVVNANRPSTKTPEEALKFLRAIEGASNMKVTGLVNNTHLLNATGAEDIIRGAGVTKALSEMTGIPLLCNAVEEALVDEVPKEIGTVFPIRVHLKKPWEV